MSAALLGWLVESVRDDPAFAQAGESPENALRRVRPILVVLLDASLASTRSDLFYTRAARRGVPVILWSQPGASDLESLAARRHLVSFTLPITRAALSDLLERAANRDRRTARERRRPAVEGTADGLIFTDRRGERWHVYDRRASERRGSSTPAAVGLGGESYRAFVSERGAEWRYAFAATEDGDAKATTLERQLAAAVRISAS